MSEFIDDNLDEQAYDDQMLEEVEVDDSAPIDDESVAGSELPDGMEEMSPAIDLSFACFKGHTDSVYCAAIHPLQPGVVISGGGDDTAYIWKFGKKADSEMVMDTDSALEGALPSAPIAQGEILSSIKLSGHTDTVTSVGFNFNGTLALTGAYDGLVKIWQVATGELLQTLEGPEDVEWAHWHNKGNAVIAGSRDGTVWMWLTHNGQCVHVFAGHDGAVTCGNFTKDGKMICTGGEDGTVRQWMPKTGQCRHVYALGDAHEAEVTCLTSGGNDADFVLSGSADGTVKLYQLSGKRLLQTFIHSARLDADATAAAAAAASADRANMRTVREGSNEMEDGEDGDMDEEGPDYDSDGGEERLDAVLGVECVGFANGEWKFVASGGMDKTLKVWDTMTGAVRCSCMHGGSVVALVWHSSLPLIATAALDNVVRIWDARNGALLQELTGHNDLVTSIDMIPITSENRIDGTGDATDMIISVSDDHTARVFLVNMASLIVA